MKVKIEYKEKKINYQRWWKTILQVLSVLEANPLLALDLHFPLQPANNTQQGRFVDNKNNNDDN